MPYLMHISNDYETRILLNVPKESDVPKIKESLKRFKLTRVCQFSYLIAKCGFCRLAVWFNENFATG